MNWYCIHTKPLKEESTAAYLGENLGLETYFPRLRQQKVIRRVRRTVTRPLFPRYLFCRFDAGLQYRAARYAPDVIDVVSFGDRPCVVDGAIIQELKGWAAEAVDIITIQPQLALGDRVTIMEGPLRGLQALIVEERTDRDRVAVLLTALECGAHVTIHRSQLERAS